VPWPGPAVAGDDRGDPLRQVALVESSRGVHDAGVAVRVQVDEPRGDDQAGAVDHSPGARGLNLANRENLVTRNGDVADVPSLARAVVDRGVLDDHVRGYRIGRERKKEKEGVHGCESFGEGFGTRGLSPGFGARASRRFPRE